MIFVNRKSVAIPKALLPANIAVEQKKAQAYFALENKTNRLQQRFKFAARVWLAARKPLAELFHGKCAYCESKTEPVSSGEIEHFRPKIETLDMVSRRTASASKTGRTQAEIDGYWWLVYDWENLYYVCPICNRNKGNQFPVAGKRANPGEHGDKLQAECALLLDPCHDNPARYLNFNEEGLVSARPSLIQDQLRFKNFNRAAVTIEILGLNRSELVEARKQELSLFRKEWERIKHDRAFKIETEKYLQTLLDPARPYCGLRYQFARKWIRELYKTIDEAARPRFRQCVHKYLPEPANLLTARHSRVKTRPARTSAQRTPPAKTKAGRSRRVVPKTSGFIRSVSIVNFKAIRQLKLRIPYGPSKTEVPQRGWKVVLGENGTGKSSILQAIALALMGPNHLRKYLRDFHLRPVDLLRKVRGRRTTDSASIEISFSNGRKVLLQIEAKRFKFLKLPPSDLFVRGYGATRLMPRRNMPSPRLKNRVLKNVNNLFDPAQPLLNVNRWLVTLKRKEFGSAALSMKDLLNLPPKPDLNIESGKVMVPLNGLKHSLEELSAGYESVLVMAADIMAGVLGTVHDFQQAPGIVLLDEIDAHLHPRWKMRIVDCLRRTFPSMQFIVSTHEPLCLRGVREKETLVVRRQNKEVTYLDELPSPSELRVDQLLTSELFGLHTTLDPVLDQKFSNYYDLLAKPEKDLKKNEATDLKKLRAELPPVRMVRLLGDNRREQLIYEVMDQYLANGLVHRNADAAEKLRSDMKGLRESVKLKIANIWKDTTILKGNAP